MCACGVRECYLGTVIRDICACKYEATMHQLHVARCKFSGCVLSGAQSVG